MEMQYLHIFATFTIAITSVHCISHNSRAAGNEKLGRKEAAAADLKNYFSIFFGGPLVKIRFSLCSTPHRWEAMSKFGVA
jgi:hypothetical protein